MNIKIYIRNPNFAVPDRMLTDGDLLLNLTAEESLSLYANVQEMNDINEIKTNGVLSFDVAETELNRMLFWNAYNPNRTCGDVVYDVTVMADCFVLDYERLSYSSYNDKNKTITLTLDYSEEHWLTKIKTINIKDLDYGSKFLLGHANVLDNWANNYFYQPGKKPYYFPLAVYGATVATHYSEGQSAIKPKMYAISSLRPWISLKWLLQEGFCAAGWTLKTSLDDTDFFKRIWSYLLREDYWQTDVKEDRGRWLRFEVEQETNTYPFVVFDKKTGNTNNDVNGNFTLCDMNVPLPGTKGHWSNPLTHSIEMLLSATMTINDSDSGDVQIGFYTFDVNYFNQTGQYNVTNEYIVPVGTYPGGNVDMIVTAEQEVLLNYGEGVYCFCSFVVVSNPLKWVKTKPGAKLKGEMLTKTYMTGDWVDVKLALDSYKIDELFSSFLHLINGKIVTDVLTKTVYVYPELRTELYNGTSIEGYYLEEGEDITDRIVSDSYQHSANKSDIARYLELKFKDSTDSYIQKIGKEKTLFAKKIDFGLRNDKTATLENPLFEPTADKDLFTFIRDTNGLGKIVVPYLTENEEGKLAYAIKPRIAISLGYIGQTKVDPNTGVPVIPGAVNKWAFEKAGHLQGDHQEMYMSEIPLITQRAEYLVGVNGERVKANLCYGDDANDLFYEFYYSYQNFLRKERSNFLMMVYPEYFFSNPFREVKRFEYEGQSVRMLLNEINDFRLSERVTSPVVMTAHPQITKKNKCNCQFVKAVFYQPFNEVTYPEPNSYKITSVKVEGVEQLTSDVNLGAKNVIIQSGANYVTNVVDAINGLRVEGLSAEYFVDANEQEPEKRMKVEMLSCLFYEIIIKTTGDVNFLRITNVGVNDWNTSKAQWKYKYDGTGDSHVRYDAYGQEKLNKINDCL